MTFHVSVDYKATRDALDAEGERDFRVGLTILTNGLKVSTVYLEGNDYLGRPDEWETMVFEGSGFEDILCQRWHSPAEAERGHGVIVQAVLAGLNF